MPATAGERIYGETEAFRTVDFALSVLIERIGKLPKADRDDFFELVEALRDETSPEEREQIHRTMLEIVAGRRVKVQPLAPIAEGDRSDELSEWVSFVSGRIKERRKSAGLTQGQLAEVTGLPQSHISRLEAGKHSPSRQTLEKLAKAFGVPLSDLDPAAE